MARMKVKIEFEIDVEPGDYEEMNESIRSELSSIIEDESPTDLDGVSVEDIDDEESED